MVFDILREVPMKDPSQKFCANHASEANYEPGLRGYFEYRDLGVAEATGGKFHAAVSRVKKGHDGNLDIRTTGTPPPPVRFPDVLRPQGMGNHVLRG